MSSDWFATCRSDILFSGYLAAQAEQDLFRHKFSEYTRRLEIACGSEVDREVHDVLAPLGVTEDVSRAVSNSLVQAALADEVASFSSSDSRALFGHRFSWMNRASKRPVPTKGTTAFLLKFGLGMEEVPSSRLFASAFTIGASYALGGLVPLVPYFFIDRAYVALYWSIVSAFARFNPATGLIVGTTGHHQYHSPALRRVEGVVYGKFQLRIFPSSSYSNLFA